MKINLMNLIKLSQLEQKIGTGIIIEVMKKLKRKKKILKKLILQKIKKIIKAEGIR